MPFPLNIQFVMRTEEKLGRRLPPGYASRMRQNNGGEIDVGADTWWLYPIFDDSDKKRLKRTCNDVVRETVTALERPQFPTQALAIGHNGGGDLLVLLANSEESSFGETVYWWDHESGDLIKVADAFDEL